MRVRGTEVARGRRHARPPAGDGPGRRRRPARRHPDHRARLRPARRLDRRRRARRGRGAGLHGRRRRVRRRHAPHRDDPRATPPSCSPARRRASCSTAQGDERGGRRGGRAGRALARRGPARAAGAAARGRVDPRPRRDPRGDRRQVPRSPATRRCSPSTRAQALGPHDHGAATSTRMHAAGDLARPGDRAGDRPSRSSQTPDGEFLAMDPSRAQALVAAAAAPGRARRSRSGAPPGAALLGAASAATCGDCASSRCRSWPSAPTTRSCPGPGREHGGCPV